METYVQIADQIEVNINGAGFNLSNVYQSYETSQDRQVDVGIDVGNVKVGLAIDGFVGAVGRAGGSKLNASFSTSKIDIGIKGLEIKNTISGLAVKNLNAPASTDTFIGPAKAKLITAAMIRDWGIHAIKTGYASAAAIRARLLEGRAQVFRAMKKGLLELKNQASVSHIMALALNASPFSVAMGGFTAGAHFNTNGQGGLTAGAQMKQQLIEDLSVSEIGDHVDEDGDDARIPEAHQGVATDVRDSVSGRAG